MTEGRKIYVSTVGGGAMAVTVKPTNNNRKNVRRPITTQGTDVKPANVPEDVVNQA